MNANTHIHWHTHSKWGTHRVPKPIRIRVTAASRFIYYTTVSSTVTQLWSTLFDIIFLCSSFRYTLFFCCHIFSHVYRSWHFAIVRFVTGVYQMHRLWHWIDCRERERENNTTSCHFQLLDAFEAAYLIPCYEQQPAAQNVVMKAEERIIFSRWFHAHSTTFFYSIHTTLCHCRFCCCMQLALSCIMWSVHVACSTVHCSTQITGMGGLCGCDCCY